VKIAVVIETHDRRLTGGENYLARTLENLARTDFWSSPYLHSLQISCGGTKDDDFLIEAEKYIPLGEEIICEAEPCTRQQNAARAIRLGSDTNADYVMKLEDDLDFLDTFLESVEAWLSDHGHAAVPMFTLAATFEKVSDSHYRAEDESVIRHGESFPRVRAMLAKGEAVAPHPVYGFYGAQCLVWRRQVAQQLADWLGPDPFLDDGREQHRQRGHDLLLQIWGKEIGARCFAASVPSFVQHIGRQSNIQNKFFEFPFPGRQWIYERRYR
jgi:hypothetical protein